MIIDTHNILVAWEDGIVISYAAKQVITPEILNKTYFLNFIQLLYMYLKLTLDQY